MEFEECIQTEFSTDFCLHTDSQNFKESQVISFFFFFHFQNQIHYILGQQFMYVLYPKEQTNGYGLKANSRILLIMEMILNLYSSILCPWNNTILNFFLSFYKYSKLKLLSTTNNPFKILIFSNQETIYEKDGE